MDSSIITGLVILAIIVLPIVFLNRSRKSAEKRWFKLLQDFAQTQNSNIAQYDIWNNNAIGIDTKLDKLFFIGKKGADKVKVYINLHDVRACAIDEVKDKSQTALDRLELAFAYKNADSGKTALEFYNTNTSNFSISNEEQLAKKWFEIIHNELAKLTHTK